MLAGVCVGDEVCRGLGGGVVSGFGVGVGSGDVEGVGLDVGCEVGYGDSINFSKGVRYVVTVAICDILG